MGVTVDLEAHYFPPATISDEGGVTWVLESPFLVTLVPSSCSSSATLSASYGVNLGGPVFMLL